MCIEFSFNPLRFSLTRETNTNIQFLNDENDQNTNFAILPSDKCGFFSVSLKVIYNCSAFGSSYFFVSFSGERKSERIKRKYKSQNPSFSC